MDKDTIGLVILVGGAASALIGGVIRYGLLPYLRENLQQTREIHQQVTSGPSSASDPSTMREELVEVREEVHQLGDKVRDAADEFSAMALMFDGHLDWSQEEVDRLWAELNRVRGGRHRIEQTDNEEDRPS